MANAVRQLTVMTLADFIDLRSTGGPDSLKVKDVLQKRQHKKIQIKFLTKKVKSFLLLHMAKIFFAKTKKFFNSRAGDDET